MSQYSKAHEYINSVNGRAAAQLCACGIQAWGWGFTYRCSTPLMDSKGRPFCRHPEHYVAMCRSCHLQHDLRIDPRAKERLLVGARKGGLVMAASPERMAAIRRPFTTEECARGARKRNEIHGNPNPHAKGKQ